MNPPLTEDVPSVSTSRPITSTPSLVTSGDSLYGPVTWHVDIDKSVSDGSSLYLNSGRIIWMDSPPTGWTIKIHEPHPFWDLYE